jgi:hypothetical protein
MQRHPLHRLVCFAAVGLCGACWLDPAVAAPAPARLDLRMSHDLPDLAVPGGPRAHTFGAYPLGAGASLDSGTDAAGFRVASPAIKSPLEILVRRAHREGLPVARLWHSQSTLISLGLNPHGKPGLWFSGSIH